MKHYVWGITLFLFVSLLIGCDEKEGGRTMPELSVEVTVLDKSDQSTIVKTFPIDEKELAMDSLIHPMRNKYTIDPTTGDTIKIERILVKSAKVKVVSGDSIIIKKDAATIKYALFTNSAWSASKYKGYQHTGSTTWFAVPDPALGGGDSRTTSQVKESTAAKARSMLIYFYTNDSTVVRKIIFTQQDKNS